MDPKACLIHAAEAIQDDDIETANDYVDDYWRWRERGGCEPTILGGDVWHTRMFGTKNVTWDGDHFCELLDILLQGYAP